MSIRVKRFIQLLCLCVGATVIYFIPVHLRATFYVPMQEVFSLTNTQIGDLAGLYGTMTIFTYLPGGWLADKFSPRKMLALSYFGTGILTFFLLLKPGYSMMMVIFALCGVTTTLTFWAALLKITRDFGKNDGQGKAFGGLEGGRGLAATVILMGATLIYGMMGGNPTSMMIIIAIFGILNILTGIFTLIVFDEIKEEKKTGENPFAGIVECAKNPNVWLISFIVLGIYTVHSVSQYIAPFANEVFAATVVFGSILSLSKQWMKPVGGFIGGFFADKIGITNMLSIGVVLLVISTGVFALVPGNPSLLILLIINTLIMFTIVAGLRGLYFANMNEAGIPLRLTGTVIGFASTIGFTADVFIPVISGRLLDAYPGGLGYRMMFGIGALFCVISFVLRQVFKKRNAKTIDAIKLEKLGHQKVEENAAE